jgi:pyridoxamine 5'-phosphate oxidase
LESRELLEAAVLTFTEDHPGEIPRPYYWRGFCLHAEQVEFWLDGPNRLHDRFLFSRDSDTWKSNRLYP